MNDLPRVPGPQQLDVERLRSLKKVRDAWQSIIERYSALNEDEQGDVVDMRTGDVIEDSGHLRSMTDSSQIPGNVWKSLLDAEKDEKRQITDDEEKEVIDLTMSPTKKRKAFGFAISSPEKSFTSISILTDSEEDGYEGLQNFDKYFSRHRASPRRTTRSTVAQKDNLRIGGLSEAEHRPSITQEKLPKEIKTSPTKAMRPALSSNLENDPLKLTSPRYSNESFSQPSTQLYRSLPPGAMGTMITPTKIRRFKEAVSLQKISKDRGNEKLKRLIWNNKKDKNVESGDIFWLTDGKSIPISESPSSEEDEIVKSEGFVSEDDDVQFIGESSNATPLRYAIIGETQSRESSEDVITEDLKLEANIFPPIMSNHLPESSNSLSDTGNISRATSVTLTNEEDKDRSVHHESESQKKTLTFAKNKDRSVHHENESRKKTLKIVKNFKNRSVHHENESQKIPLTSAENKVRSVHQESESQKKTLTLTNTLRSNATFNKLPIEANMRSPSWRYKQSKKALASRWMVNFPSSDDSPDDSPDELPSPKSRATIDCDLVRDVVVISESTNSYAGEDVDSLQNGAIGESKAMEEFTKQPTDKNCDYPDIATGLTSDHEDSDDDVQLD
ncbi:hypothetical protein CANARDRAFT_7716 [[Candida] arabinofermentans NRRL YB-2248]|uniref:Uncharacterized protein n=1 Tax=[Candida] arabinofermentans NRRL YB-2248 TaxID=983967 RepID=A0A1E4T1H1_9ASCO|nr:hypothetical protein CANARDRAFT_7716 [[Candida] arabinofermentans NRRL YB-2248]